MEGSRQFKLRRGTREKKTQRGDPLHRGRRLTVGFALTADFVGKKCLSEGGSWEMHHMRTESGVGDTLRAAFCVSPFATGVLFVVK